MCAQPEQERPGDQPAGAPGTPPATAKPAGPAEAPPAAELISPESPTDPEPPDDVEQTLRLTRPGIAIKREFDGLAAEHNMRFAAANTILFQQATGGPG